MDNSQPSQFVQYIPILFLLAAAVGFAGGTLAVSVLFGKFAKSSKAKDAAYECGKDPIGEGTSRFSVKFYLVAMLFILFDIEVVFMYPSSDPPRPRTPPTNAAKTRLAKAPRASPSNFILSPCCSSCSILRSCSCIRARILQGQGRRLRMRQRPDWRRHLALLRQILSCRHAVHPVRY